MLKALPKTMKPGKTIAAAVPSSYLEKTTTKIFLCIFSYIWHQTAACWYVSIIVIIIITIIIVSTFLVARRMRLMMQIMKSS